jgi:hypothetical protein
MYFFGNLPQTIVLKPFILPTMIAWLHSYCNFTALVSLIAKHLFFLPQGQYQLLNEWLYTSTGASLY